MERFHATKETAMDVLAEHGVAIIPSVLNQEECWTMLTKMWEFFEEITVDAPTPVRRGDESTWNTLLDYMPAHSMLFQHWGVGHADFAWWLRQHPAVVEVFSTMWNTPAEDLLVSFDGASFQAPPDRAGNPTPRRGWGSEKHWLHSDQSLRRPNRECIQGWVTALPVEDGDATLGVVTKSHQYHEEVARRWPALVGPKNWVRYDDEVVHFFETKGGEHVRITCPAGSLVLWDSRTAHQGAPPLKDRATPKFRAVCYVCYLPRSIAAPKDIVKKREAYTARRTTSHWPNRAINFALKPRTYGKTLPRARGARVAALSALGRKLAGFDG